MAAVAPLKFADAPAEAAAHRIAVLVPVLGRPHRVRPFLESLAASSRFIGCYPVFLVSASDEDERAALAASIPLYWDGGDGGFALVCDWEPGPGDYARKINYGAQWACRGSWSEFVFLGADDLHFRPGWAERALACYLETGACVVGTSDGGNRQTVEGHHSTHTLVHRDYLECGTVDEPDSRKLLHEGYDHQFVDTEFVATAMARETWAHAGDCLVEHRHPQWGKAERDPTYDKGQRAFAEDRLLFNSRRPLWGG